MEGNRNDHLYRRVSMTRGELLRLWGPWILLALVVGAISFAFIKPAPPRRVVLAAGPKDGAYYWFANQYAQTFKDNGITLDVRETKGTPDNYRLLDEDESVSLAIVQGGAAPEKTKTEIQSIASLYVEPVWVFHRGRPTDQPEDLAGKKIAIGAPGSGTAALARRILATTGVYEADANTSAATKPARTATFVSVGGQSEIDALTNGEVDAAFFVISPRSPLVAKLLETDGIQLMNFDRHEAYTHILPFLSSVTLCRGVVSMDRDLPKKDVRLVAPAANLVCRESLHPAIIPMAAKAAVLAHEKGDLISRPGQFPSVQYVEHPLDPAAREFFKSGPPLLQRYLPFWVAAMVDRLKILILPLLTLLIPLFRIAPPIFRWRASSRIYRWYRLVQEVDRRCRDPQTPMSELRTDAATMRDLDEELSRMKVSLSYMEPYYHLRLHVDLIQRHLAERLEPNGVVS